MPHINAKMNQYAEWFMLIYDRTPKAVFAAVCFSLLSKGGDFPKGVTSRFLREWRTLFINKIVPQSVPTVFLNLIEEEEVSEEDDGA